MLNANKLIVNILNVKKLMLYLLGVGIIMNERPHTRHGEEQSTRPSTSRGNFHKCFTKHNK